MVSFVCQVKVVTYDGVSDSAIFLSDHQPPQQPSPETEAFAQFLNGLMLPKDVYEGKDGTFAQPPQSKGTQS